MLYFFIILKYMKQNEILGYYKYDGTITTIDDYDYIQLKLLGDHAEKINAITLVSKDSLDIVLKYKWYLSKNGYPKGYQTYGQKKKRTRKAKLHRLVMGRVDKGMVVDHIDTNRLNNTLQNLRVCTPKQNSYNRSKNKNRKYKGTYKGRKNTWTARATKDGTTHEIKDIETEEEAARMYDIMAEELFGKYCNKNFDK